MQSKIFLADQRGTQGSSAFRRYCTFNFGSFSHADKQAFGALSALNDAWLAGGKKTTITAPYAATLLLLPITGAMAVNDVHFFDEELVLAAGQGLCRQLVTGEQLELTNLFASNAANYIEIWLQETDAQGSGGLANVDVNGAKNTLARVPFHLGNIACFVGKFDGRGETTFTPPPACTHAYVFVLHGAFEVAGCLLHARDGLAISQPQEVEMEALSNEAILLLLAF